MKGLSPPRRVQDRRGAGVVTLCIVFNWILMNPRVWDDVPGFGAHRDVRQIGYAAFVRTLRDQDVRWQGQTNATGDR